MRGVLVCKSCLITNVKMFNLDTMANVYSELTGLQCEDTKTQYVCYQCAALIHKFQQFRTKCLKANQVMLAYAGKYYRIETVVGMIDRKLHNLESTIKFAIKENFYYEIYNESESDQKENKDPEQCVKIGIDNVIDTRKMKELYDHNYASYEKHLKDELHVTEKIHIKDKTHLEDGTRSEDETQLEDETHSEGEIYLVVEVHLEDGTHSEDKTQLEDGTHSEGEIYLVDEVHLEDGTHSEDETQLEDGTHSEGKIYLVDEVHLEDTKDTEHETAWIKTGQRKQLDQESVKDTINNSNTKAINKGNYILMEKYVKIVNLTPKQARQEILLRKESRNYKANLYKCDLCYKGYGTPQTYQNHMKTHSLEFGEYECPFCHVRSSRKSLIRHIKSCHTKKYVCKLCPYTCFSSTQAMTHMNRHKGMKYPCEQCGQMFSMRNSLSTHQRYKHGSELVCSMCGSIFGKQRGFKAHMARFHKTDTNEQQGPLCEECDVHFATETAWKRHLVLSSKHTVSNGCQVCGETYESKDALKRHAEVHPRNYLCNSSLSFECTWCGQLLFRKAQYYKHIKTHHPDVNVKSIRDLSGKKPIRTICEVCGATFKNKALLTNHQRVHTGEKPFPCDKCGKSFRIRAHLKAHLVSHSSVRHKCHLCEQTYLRAQSLTLHINTHHFGIRPHNCNFCSKTFSTRCAAKYHMQYVHLKTVPWPKRDRSKIKKGA